MMNDDRSEVAQRLGAIIRRARLDARDHRMRTQAALTAAAGIEQTQLSRWELGKVMPDVLELNKVERALDLRLGTLLIMAGLVELPEVPTEQALMTDPSLMDWERQALLALYRTRAAAQGDGPNPHPTASASSGPAAP